MRFLFSLFTLVFFIPSSLSYVIDYDRSNSADNSMYYSRPSISESQAGLGNLHDNLGIVGDTVVNLYQSGPVKNRNGYGSSGSLRLDDNGRDIDIKKSDKIKVEVAANVPASTRASDDLLNAYYAMNEGSVELALSHYTDVLSKEPDNVDALFGSGLSYYLLSQDDDAIKSYMKLLSIDPKHTDAINNLSVAVANKDPVIAVDILSKIEALGGGNPVIYAQLGSLYGSLNQDSKAMRYLLMSIDGNPDDSVACYNVAVMYDKMSDYRQSLKYYNKVLDLVGFSDDTILNLYEIKERVVNIRSLLAKS